VGDVFDYDNNDQVTVVKLNIANPDTTAPGSQTIHYDTNGNRTSFAPYGTTDNYTTNNLNEYTVRNSSSAAYNASADMTTGFDGSTYTYDAQDRLLSATESGVTETFDYDGLNRQVSRTVAGVTTYNVYDGWALIEEYQSGGMTAAYLHGATGLVKDLTTNNYYYQDGSGSTSHLADSAGNLLEWYRYDLQGTPVFYNFANTQQSASAYSVRHLFTGQKWYSELGLYDLRNRFYSPDIGRFLQPDPAGFGGDATNLYRYCGNNPTNAADPTGLNIQLWTTPTGGTTPWHAYWGVTIPNGTVYYDFSPQGDPGWFAETFGSVPGHWDVNDNISDTATLMTEWETTPGEDYSVMQAFNDHYGNQSDSYSAPYNNCYSRPERIIADALSGEDDGEELAEEFMSYFTSSVSTPIGAFGVGGQGGSFFVSSGSGLNIPGGINWNPAGCGPSVLPSGFLGGSYGPLTPSQWKWFLYPAGMQKPSYKSYLANYPQGVSLGANKGKSASAFTGARGQ
jgi:RHS repeat-associated protein